MRDNYNYKLEMEMEWNLVLKFVDELLYNEVSCLLSGVDFNFICVVPRLCVAQ